MKKLSNIKAELKKTKKNNKKKKQKKNAAYIKKTV